MFISPGKSAPGDIPTVDPASTSGNSLRRRIQSFHSGTLVYSTYFGTTGGYVDHESGGGDLQRQYHPRGRHDLQLVSDAQRLPIERLRVSAMHLSRGSSPRDRLLLHRHDRQRNAFTGAPSAIGTYTVVASFTSTDPNYTDAQSDPVTFTISPSGSGHTHGYGLSIQAATTTAVPSRRQRQPWELTANRSAARLPSRIMSARARRGAERRLLRSMPALTVVASFTSCDPDYSNAQSQPVTFTISPATTATSVGRFRRDAGLWSIRNGYSDRDKRRGIPTAGNVTFYDGATPLANSRDHQRDGQLSPRQS